MSARLAILAALIVPLVVGLALVGWLVARRPLPRRTVDRFATRQRLQVVEENATLVVSALLITHRWRRAGLAVGLLAGLLWSIQRGALTLSFAAGLLGWFVGAVIAEWRISSLEQPGPRRSAGLAPRGITTYLTAPVIGVAAVVVAALVVLILAAAVRSGLSMSWLGWVLYSVALLAALALTGRTIIERPSGFVDGDLRAADDALRCHGLTVLAGAGVATAYPALAGLALVTSHPDGVPPAGEPMWTLLILVACLVVGFLIAASSTSARAARVEQPVGADPT